MQCALSGDALLHAQPLDLIVTMAIVLRTVARRKDGWRFAANLEARLGIALSGRFVGLQHCELYFGNGCPQVFSALLGRFDQQTAQAPALMGAVDLAVLYRQRVVCDRCVDISGEIPRLLRDCW